MRYVDENRNWGQRNGYGRKYGNGNKSQQRRAHGGSATQTQTYYTTPKGRISYRNTPSRRIGGGQGDGNGEGEDKDDKNRKRYRDTKYDLEEKDEEESDTEDSFEFEITARQLSQVTPGGGVLKLTLSRKGPLKITTEAQGKKPDPPQTTIKTVYGPTKEEGPLQGGGNTETKTTSRRGEKFENQRVSPERHLMIREMRASLKMGVQLGKSIQVVMVVLMGMGDQIKAGNHPERGKNHQMGLEE